MPSRHAVPLTPSVFQHLSQLPRCEQNEQSNFHSPYTLPSSVSCKSSACHSYENTGGVGVFFPFWNSLVGCRGFDPGNECLSKSSTDCRQLSHCHSCFKSFRCNTYASPRKCCKQKTYSPTKSFRCNTYKKTGGSAPRDVSIFRRSDVQSASRMGLRDARTTCFRVTSLPRPGVTAIAGAAVLSFGRNLELNTHD